MGWFSRIAGLLLLSPHALQLCRLGEAMAGHHIAVAPHAVWLAVVVELVAVEGLQVCLLGNQPQPDVVEAEELGEVAGVVHVHQGVARQHVGS